MGEVLRLRGVSVSYGHVEAVREVSLAVEEGEMVALLGANGAGKTTTLRAASGLVPLDRGDVEVDGERVTGRPPEQVAARGVAHIPEDRGIFPRLTVWQNLKMGGYAARLPGGVLAERAEEALGVFPALRRRMQVPAGRLSGGEQQMVAIARALIGAPRLLMLDEPSHGLAPAVVQEVFELLARLRDRGAALLVVEQHATAALSVADRAAVLDRGRLVLAGDARDLADDRAALAGAYLGGGDTL